MNMAVIDTDVFIDYLRGYPPAVKFLQKLDKLSTYFSAATEAELLAGDVCRISEHRDTVLHLLEGFTKVVIDNPIAQAAGYFKMTYQVELVDAFIAATAFHTNSELITRNLKDFQKIKEIKARAPY